MWKIATNASGTMPELFAVLLPWVVGLLMLGFNADRSDFGTLMFWIGLAFMAYVLVLEVFEWDDRKYRRILWVAILMRLALVLAFPLLSDDIYRFLWDGRLILSGISPFAELPSQLVSAGLRSEAFDVELFIKLNSKDYYSVYPPVCQSVFAAGAFFFPKNIYGFAVFLKLVLFCCEVGTLFFLEKMNISVKKKLVYALNPLLILEFCGNAHFEAVMLFFFVAALYHLHVHDSDASKTSVVIGAAMLSLSIASKLITVLFLPFLMRHLGWKKGLQLAVFTGVFVILAFWPFYDKDFISHFLSSVSLYFRNFEFNASLYYLMKIAGNCVYGYTPVALLAGIGQLVLMLGMAYLMWSRRNFFSAAFLLFTLYLLLQRAVHPWYLGTLVLLSVFVPWRFGILWSGLVMLSYSHYNQNIYQENPNLLVAEYFLLFGFVFWELFSEKRQHLKGTD